MITGSRTSAVTGTEVHNPQNKDSTSFEKDMS